MDKTTMIGMLLGFTVLIVLSALILNKQKKCSSENYANDDWVLVKYYNVKPDRFPIRVSLDLQKKGDVFSGKYAIGMLSYKPLKITLNKYDRATAGYGSISVGSVGEEDHIDADFTWKRGIHIDKYANRQPYIYIDYGNLVLTKGGVLDMFNMFFDKKYPAAKKDFCGKRE